LLIDRRGARGVIAGSALLFALGVFLLPTFPNSLLFFGLVTFLIGLVAIGTAPVGYLSVLPRVFSQRLGLALGLSMTGLGVGAMLFPIAAQIWIAAYGWGTAYRLMAGVILLLGVLAVPILSWGAGPAASVAGARKQDRLGSPAGDTLQAALCSWRFWMIGAVFFVTGAYVLGAVIHMSALLTDRGIPPHVAAGIVSLIGVGLVVGRVGTGAMLDRFPVRAVTGTAFLLGSAGLCTVVPEVHASLPVIAAGAVLLGVCVGAEGDLMPFIVRRQFGLKSLGALYGVIFSTYALGAMAGPVVYALAFDATRSYSVVLESGIAACACCALMTTLVGPTRFGVEIP
jgi:MFS family permease